MKNLQKISLVIAVLVIGFLSYKIFDLNKKINLLNQNDNTSDLILDKLNMLETLLKADSLTSIGQYDEAKKLLENATFNKNEMSNYTQNRIKLLDEYVSSSKEINVNMDTVSDEVKQIMKVMRFKNDSLVKSHKKASDSLFGQITQLREQLLNTKVQPQMSDEKVQVITFKGLKGTKIHYLGEVKGGKANGNGVGIWTTGSVYKGEWRNNIRHGQGIYEWADGERYEGTYVDGKRQGFGKYYWPNGERYEGQWMDDRRNGKGTLFDPDSNVKFEGEWRDDKPLKK
ncbi:MAG: hypothetical protein ACK4FS_03405 [Flavobacterium sp.]